MSPPEVDHGGRPDPIQEPMPAVVDAHHHLWDPSALPYSLFTTYPRLAPLIPLGSVAAYDAMARAQGIVAGVCVEVASAGADGDLETAWLVERSLASDLPRGIVAWAPVEQAGLEPWLAHLGTLPVPVVGVRRSFEAVADGFILGADVERGVRALVAHGLVFDLVLFGPRLREAAELAARLPEVTFVLDHLGKPSLDSGSIAAWEEDLALIAACPNVVAKLSGLLTIGDVPDQDARVRHLVAVALERFGPSRLMAGTDWPVCELIDGGVGRWLGLLADAIAGLDRGERDSILVETVRRVYRLP